MGIIKDPTSWRAGFELGLAGFSFPYSKPRKPIAYLYNGVELPALPVEDTEKYPYVFLYTYHSRTYLNYHAHRPFFSDGKFCMVNPSISFVLENDAFTDKRENGLDNLVFGSTEDKLQLIWTNFDVLNDDGSVYMAAGYTNYPDAPPVPAETITDPCPDKSVMYLYDDASTDEVGDTVTLPAIPEVDLRVYPYMGVRYSSSRYVLILSRHPIWYGRELANYSYCYRQESDSPNEWTSLGAHRYGYPTIWANYDVYDVDGNRVIAASTPTPVYE